VNAPQLRLAGSEEADALLSSDPLALLIGLVLDQQVTMEKAFTGPLVLQERLGHRPTVGEIAAADIDELTAIFAKPPAVHRFPAAMAKRVQALCVQLRDEYDGVPDKVWTGAADGADLLRRIKALPGFGEQKAKITVALLGKRLNVRPAGWQKVAGVFGESGVFRSVADITDDQSLQEVRKYKQEQKAAARR
jgi:uncharacterized HhH-GPD family protein